MRPKGHQLDFYKRWITVFNSLTRRNICCTIKGIGFILDKKCVSKDLVKIVKAELESAKVAVRNIRRDALNDFRDLLKDKSITEDELRQSQEEIQKNTDEVISKMSQVSLSKEEEIMEF